MKSLNTRIIWYWTLYCIVGCTLLPDIVLGARYLPTRRSMPTQLERNERLNELFQHILESERDAHLSAANKYADQLKLIQKKTTDFGFMPEQTNDYTDGFGYDYDDKIDHSTVYGGGRTAVHLQQQQQQQKQQQQKQQQQPWHFILNYGRHAHRNHNLDQNNANSKVISADGASLDDLLPFHTPRSQPNQQQHRQQQQFLEKLHRDKQQKSAPFSNTIAGDTNERANDLDWITSTSERLNSATDYDALYDDVNEKQRSPSSSSSSSPSLINFDRYRRNGPLLTIQSKHQLN